MIGKKKPAPPEPPKIAIQCPNAACRCSYWTGVKTVFTAAQVAGSPPERFPAGDLVECVKCGTIYSITPTGVLMAPSFAQPVARGPAPREDRYNTNTDEPSPDNPGRDFATEGA